MRAERIRRRLDRITTTLARPILDPTPYRTNPTDYARLVLRSRPTPQQEQIARALVRPPYRVLIPSANNVGKTHCLGWLVNWHHDTHDPGVVLATSATYRQVKSQLFKEVRRLRPRTSLAGLKPRAPEIYRSPQHFVLGFSAANPDAFQGHHESSLLLVFDEATGVGSEFWDRAETMFQPGPGHGWVCAYNPNDPTSPPYAAEQSGGWAVERLSALDHPNIAAELRGEAPPVPAAVRLAQVQRRIERECEDCGHTRTEGAFEFPPGSDRWYKPVDPKFAPQVLGRWPDQSAYSVWGEELRRKCAGSVLMDPRWPTQVGCDVARAGGNRTAFAVRRGTALVHLEERTRWPTHRINQHIADRLRDLCHQYCPEGEDPRSVPCVIDVTGGYGAGVCDFPAGYTFLGVNSSSTAHDPLKYPNTRSELWFVAKAAAEEGGVHTGNVREGRDLVEQLWTELTAARYSLDSRDRVVVEGKSSMIERLGVSPDLADSMNLAWYPVQF